MNVVYQKSFLKATMIDGAKKEKYLINSQYSIIPIKKTENNKTLYLDPKLQRTQKYFSPLW